jgi:methionyl-tRNA formyltransferase
MRLLIANANPVHAARLSTFAAEVGADIVTTPAALLEAATKETFDYIFFPHWSHLIPATVYERQECVLFHMTDLPYGRGGSPLQNLIVRGHRATQMTALRVSKGLDTGPVYLKEPLSLLGTAREIFMRAGELMVVMMREIIERRPQPREQEGEPTLFKRRKPQDGNLAPLQELDAVYDYIRMLDADSYPPAFLETDALRFELFRASLHPDKVVADVRIVKK